AWNGAEIMAAGRCQRCSLPLRPTTRRPSVGGGAVSGAAAEVPSAPTRRRSGVAAVWPPTRAANGEPAMIGKVISGGQTGVDQVALRAAKACGIPTGGWAPKGWRTEDGAGAVAGRLRAAGAHIPGLHGWDAGERRGCRPDAHPGDA